MRVAALTLPPICLVKFLCMCVDYHQLNARTRKDVFPLPHIEELCSFLGFTSYYCSFVEGFAKLAAHLDRLVAEFGSTKSWKRAEQSFTSDWTTHCQKF